MTDRETHLIPQRHIAGYRRRRENDLRHRLGRAVTVRVFFDCSNILFNMAGTGNVELSSRAACGPVVRRSDHPVPAWRSSNWTDARKLCAGAAEAFQNTKKKRPIRLNADHQVESVTCGFHLVRPLMHTSAASAADASESDEVADVFVF